MAEGVVDPLEVVEVDAERRHAAAVAGAAGEHFLHALVEEDAVGQAGERVVVGHEGDARLGSLALGDVDGGDHDGVGALVVQPAGEDGDVDGFATGLAVRPCAAGLLFLRGRAEPGEGGVAGARMDERQRAADERVAREAVVRHRRLVGGEDGAVGERIDEHRHGIVFEQQAEGGLALLELGDVDAQPDGAAVARLPFLDEDDAPVGEPPARGGCAARGVSPAARASHACSRPTASG